MQELSNMIQNKDLSMGMSNDYIEAIKFKSTSSPGCILLSLSFKVVHPHVLETP